MDWKDVGCYQNKAGLWRLPYISAIHVHRVCSDIPASLVRMLGSMQFDGT
jgi:hypothetical protein